MNDIEVGDVVQLKGSGGPNMTVEMVYYDCLVGSHTGENTETTTEVARVLWFVDSDLKVGVIATQVLEKFNG